MVDAVIFDLDGTLIDSMGIYETVKFEVLKKMGFNLTKSEKAFLENIYYMDFIEEFEKLLNTKIDEHYFIQTINKEIRKAYQKGFELKPGVLQFLDYLDKNNIKYCLATASKNINAINALKNVNLLDRFEFVITTSDVGFSKLHSEVYDEACEMLNSRPENTYVFEDAIYAVKSAKSSNYKVVGIYDEYYKEHVEEIKEIADYFINDYFELLDLIKKDQFIINGVLKNDQVGVIFDLDGTLSYSEGIYQKLKYDILADMGYKLSVDEILRFKDVNYYDFVKVYQKEYQNEIDEMEFFHYVNTRVRRAYESEVKIKEGVIELLDYLDANNIKYSLATAAKNVNANAFLKRYNILERFTHVITTTDVDRSKAYPTLYKEAAIKMNTNFNNTYVFEDSLKALKVAKAAGFKVVGVYDDNSFLDQKEIKKLSDLYIKDYYQFVSDLKSDKIKLKHKGVFKDEK